MSSQAALRVDAPLVNGVAVATGLGRPYLAGTTIGGDLGRKASVVLDHALINSVAVATGRHVAPGEAFADAMAACGGDERVLFAQGDDEVLAMSGALRTRQTVASARNQLALELRILTLAVPDSGYLVIPPTYYLESPLCREVILAHRGFVEEGLVRLSLNSSTLDAYLERKSERYAKARHFSRYRLAYFSRTSYGISELGFTPALRTRSVGAAGLDAWTYLIDQRARRLRFPRRPFRDFVKRVHETEQPSFLIENVYEHVAAAGIASGDARVLGMRSIKNSSYLAGYRAQGVWLPEGSSVASFAIVPRSPGLRYNVVAWRRLFDTAGLTTLIATMAPSRLVQIRRRPEVSAAIDAARGALTRAGSSAEALRSVRRDRTFRDLAAAFSAQ